MKIVFNMNLLYIYGFIILELGNMLAFFALRTTMRHREDNVMNFENFLPNRRSKLIKTLK